MCLSLSETIQRLFMLLRLSLLFFSLRLKNPSVTKIEYGNILRLMFYQTHINFIRGIQEM